MPRGNVSRTGATSGISDLASPVPYWRYYLGGALAPDAAIPADVDGDGRLDVLFLSGGRVVAKSVAGFEIWSSQALGLLELAGVADLDGDGKVELIAEGQSKIFVLSTDTGEILWSQPDDDFGWLGGTRIADINNDGVSDLLVQECACCRVKSENTGFAYTFTQGYSSAQKLWTLPSIRCRGYHSMAIVSATGDQRRQFLLGTNDTLSLLDASDGEILATSPDLGERLAEAHCIPKDVDGEPGEEVVCVLKSNVPFLDGTGHRVFALQYDEQSESLRVLWEHDVGELDAQVSIPADFVSDLTGDGRAEVVVSGLMNSGEWNTDILDASTGQLLATIAGHVAVGTSVLDTLGATVLTSKGDDLFAWRIRPGASPTQLWSLSGEHVVITHNWDRARISSLTEGVLAIDIDDDGLLDLITEGTSGLSAFSMNSASAPVLVASLPMPSEAEILQAWPLDSAEGAFMVADSRGFLHVVDKDLDTLTPDGIRFGGYLTEGDWRRQYKTPVAGNLGGVGESLLLPDSRGRLIRLDARGTSIASPPTPVWAVDDSTGPILVSNSGEPAIACRQAIVDSPNHRVAVLSAAGQELWHYEPGGRVLSGLLPAIVGVSELPGIIIEWGLGSDRALQHTAVSLADGSPVWKSPPATPGSTRSPAGAAIADWNADGVDDLLYQFYGTHVINGIDGTPLASSPYGPVYFMPTIYDLDGDGIDEVTLQGGYDSARSLSHDLSTELWVGDEIDRPYPYGSITRCPDRGPLLVEGSLVNAARLRVTNLSGPSQGSSRSKVLAGGKVFDSEAQALAAGHLVLQLTSTAIHENLGGVGDSTVIVGSDDGWLYALDPCLLELQYSIDFGTAVGAAMFADTDGDGLDEIIVSVADGYLYGLKQPSILAPSFVYDTSPSSPDTGGDLDETTSLSIMSARWETVPGVTTYQVAVVESSSQSLLGTWQDVGIETHATIASLELQENRKYQFAVRATKDGTLSPDALSDGVIVHDQEKSVDDPQETSSPSGCGCNATNSESSLFFIALALVMLFRRRKTGE